MPKKRSPSSLPIYQNLFRLTKPSLAISFALLLCFITLLSLHPHHRFHLSTFPTFHTSKNNNSNKIESHFEGFPKIAFLFLSRRNLPLDFLWGAFFKNGNVEKFTIYVHSEPGFVFNESTTKSHFFYGRQLSNSIQVKWGESSMIEAERLLLKAALKDSANQKFVLLSDSCVPLYNFSYVYSHVMLSPRSFVDSFLDMKEHRYSPKMAPAIHEEKWRKGAQWITLIRKHAEVVVDDDTVLPVFKFFCKRRQPVNATTSASITPKPPRHRNCIPDEHYVQTLLAIKGLEDELEGRTLTYTLWNQTGTKLGKNAWHPITFSYGNASPQQIKEIKEINHVYYESESRSEWCQINSMFTTCFLFARKFSRGAATRLLTEGVIGPFDASALWNRPP